MENTKKPEAHSTSAAAFVEGGTQEACDDACSICLEAFSDGNPSTVTSCKHEFHLQCILEWCQRSSQCPMCWQSISLKDPTSQELLQAVEQERSFRFNSSRTDAIFHHPAFADFNLQHLSVGANDAELEERLIQHLAAAAAIWRAHHIARREGQRSRPSAQGHSQLLVFSARPNSNVAGTASSSPSQRGEGEQIPAVGPLSPTRSLRESSHSPTLPISAKSGSTVLAGGRNAISMNNCTPNQTSSSSQARAGSSSEIQSFSDSLKSRFTSMSMRYKDSISKSTKGLKERWFSRHASVADLGSEVEREVNAGIATVPRTIECLETRDDSRPNVAPVSNRMENNPAADISHQRRAETGCNNCLADACPSGTGSSSN